MRQLLPTPTDDVEVLDLYLADIRTPHADRPWLMCNMVSSVDGATAIDGRSGGLGGPGDKAVFAALRASCDWILVASGTAVAERYGRPQADDVVRARRVDQGRSPVARLAIVSASGRVDPTLPAFSGRPDDEEPVLVITGTEADTAALDAVDVEVVRLDTPTPDPAAVLAMAHRRGAAVVLTEGGPRFNGFSQSAGLFDEMCVTVSPVLAGGESSRVIAGATGAAPSAMRLARLLEDDGTLFARYIRDRGVRD